MDQQQILEALKAFFALVWSFAGVKFLVSHVLINVVAAGSAALKSGDFLFSKLGEFLTKKLLPFVAVYAIAKAVGMEAGLEWLAPAVWVLIEGILTANLLDNLNTLGVPLPSVLKRFTVKE